MPYCYYTCNLVPSAFLSRSGYEPKWFGAIALDAELSGRYDSPNVHPMTCPFVTRLVTAAEKLLAKGSLDDRVVVPGGCDAMRRAGDLLASQYPDQVRTFRLPRLSDGGALLDLARELETLAQWLDAPRESGVEPAPPAVTKATAGRPESGGASKDRRRGFELPSTPLPGGVFVVGGPMSDDSLLRLIQRLGSSVSGVQSCTAPDRWQALDEELVGGGERGRAAEDGGDGEPGGGVTVEDTARLILEAGVCPRRSSVDRRAYLAERLSVARPSSVIYARQSFCDPGAYDALLVAELAAEQGLPFLEVEVGFPLEISGPLRTRVEAFLEAQLLDDDLLGDLDDLDDDLLDDDLQDDLRDDFGDPANEDVGDDLGDALTKEEG
jgi:2-hydroxyglutaryl-CoA dehydratase, D-component